MITLAGDDFRPGYKRVARALRCAISDGTYRAGEVAFSAVDLADQLGMSRSTIDEALRRLAQEGLMESTIGRGWRITWQAPRLAPLMLAVDRLDQELARVEKELGSRPKTAVVRAMIGDLGQAIESIRVIAASTVR